MHKPPRRPHPGLAASPRQVAAGLLVALLGFGLLAAVSWTRPTTTAGPVDYTHDGEFTYTATAASGPVYGSPRVRTGQPLFLALVDDVRVGFSYRLTVDEHAAVRGTIALDARVDNGTGWSRTLQLAGPQPFAGDQAQVTGDLDIGHIRSLVAEAAEATGESGVTTITLHPQVTLDGELAGRALPEGFRPSLAYQLTDTQLRVAEGADDDAPFTVQETGQVQAPHRQAATFSWAGRAMDVATARWLSLVAAIASAAGLVILLAAGRRTAALSEAERITRRWPELILAVDVEEVLAARVVRVRDIAALVTLAQRSDRPLLHDRATDAFLLELGGSQYRYEPVEPVVAPPAQARPLVTAGAERGSIPLGLLVIIVISGLVRVMLGTTVSAQRQARHDTDFTTVLYAADAAVEQAQFRLSASTSSAARMPEVSSTLTGVQESCPLLGESWCIAGGSAETGRYEWYAQRLGHTRSWEVTAVGERNDVQRRLRVVVEEGRRFFAAAFADSIANFGNNNVADSYDSGRGERTERWPGPGRAGWVGSNGPVETGGSSSVLDGLQLFNLVAAGTSDPVTQCTGQGGIGLETSRQVCSDWAKANPVGSAQGPYLQGSPQPRVIAPGPQDLRAAMGACGPGPYPALTVDSAGVHVTPGTTAVTVRTVAALQPFRMEPATLPDGQPNPFVGVGRGAAPEETNYYCFRSVRISVDTTIVAPQTDTHMTGTDIPTTTEGWTPAATMANPDDPVTVYVTGNVEIETTRRLNCVACSRPFPTDPVAFPPPRSGALQVFLQSRQDSDPIPGFRVGNDARFGGAIHGPSADCGGSGSLSTAGTAADVYGALVCDTIGGVGQWHFHYDESLEFIGNTDFGTQQWEER